MTTELTHEEAAALRMTSFPSDDAYTLHLSGMIDCIDGQRCHYRLSDKGHEALANYDAKWVTVQRDSKLGQRAEFDCIVSDLVDQINDWRGRAEAAELLVRTVSSWIERPGEAPGLTEEEYYGDHAKHIALGYRRARSEVAEILSHPCRGGGVDAKWSTVRKDDLQIAVRNLDDKIDESDAKCHLYGLQSELYKLDHVREALARLQEAVK